MEFTTPFEWVPIAGAVMALIGVILDIVGIILGVVYPQETPAEKFIKGPGSDFLKTITIDPKVTEDKKKKEEDNHDVIERDVTDKTDLPQKWKYEYCK